MFVEMINRPDARREPLNDTLEVMVIGVLINQGRADGEMRPGLRNETFGHAKAPRTAVVGNDERAIGDGSGKRDRFETRRKCLGGAGAELEENLLTHPR